MPHSRWETLTIGAGSSFAIDQVADNGGTCRFRTTTAHGFATGEVVRISGASAGDEAYNGLQTITNVSDATHFDTDEVFGSTATATVTDGTATTSPIHMAFGERIVSIESPSELAAAADIVVQIARDGTNYLDFMDIAGNLIRVMSLDLANANQQSVADGLTALSWPIGNNKVRLRSVNTGSSADVNLVDTPAFRILLSKD